jgi:hypothetical protein
MMTIVIRAATLMDSSAIIVGFMDISDESVEGDVRGVPVQVGTTQTGYRGRSKPRRPTRRKADLFSPCRQQLGGW